MTDKPAAIQERKKDRRGLLALMGAGGAAAVAALLSQRDEARAHGTTHTTSNSSDPAIHGDNTSTGDGVQGTAASGTGVVGINGGGGPSSNIGVRGTSINDVFVAPSGRIGVFGNGDNVGVMGSGPTGVEGAGQSFGVRGVSPTGTGVKGRGKPGVYGICSFNNGSGVRGDGDAPGSIGVFAKNVANRRALRTRGRVQMDTVRKKTLADKSNLITLPTGVSAGSKAAIMVTVQGNPGNDAVIRRAFRVDAKHIRIAFTKKPANPVSVAYWVVHPS